MYDWKDFVWCADQWFVTCATIPDGLIAPSWFSIGFVVELYLKATYVKQTGSAQGAINCGHDIKKLWDACKGNDPNFMPDYELRKSVLDSMKAGLLPPKRTRSWEQSIRPDDFHHYTENQEF